MFKVKFVIELEVFHQKTMKTVNSYKFILRGIKKTKLSFDATISFDYVYTIPAPSQVLIVIICGKILCEHCQSWLKEYDNHNSVYKNCESA